MLKTVLHWFRRDLRLDDNVGLYHALSSSLPVLPIFIFDKNILDELEPLDRRVIFINQCLSHIQNKLSSIGSKYFLYIISSSSIVADTTINLTLLFK